MAFAPLRLRDDWRERLDELHTAEGQPLPPCLKAEIVRECRRLWWQVFEMISEVEAEQRRSAEDTAGRLVQLSRLRGIG